MGKILAMDESGNTQEIAALALVSIPRKELSLIQKLLSVEPIDPHEIQVLYEKRCKGEFKYSVFRNAYRTTGLDVYDVYLKKKLKEIAALKIQVYCSIFRNPKENNVRRFRLMEEARYLIHTWAHQNKDDALDRELEITVDQQVFPEKLILDYNHRRGQFNATIWPAKRLEEAIKAGIVKRVHGDRENQVVIQDANSLTNKTIQLTDMVVGCIRERYALATQEYYQLLSPLIFKQRMRVQLGDYTPPEMKHFRI